MRAAGKRIVQRNDVARADLDFAQGRGDSHWHRAEMNGHVVALRDHATR